MSDAEKNSIVLPGWLLYKLSSERDEEAPTENPKKGPIRPMSEVHKRLANVLSEEIFQQRMEHKEDYNLTLNATAAEGLEKLLWALANEDYSFANVRVAQLIDGLLEDAPKWRPMAGEEEEEDSL